MTFEAKGRTRAKVGGRESGGGVVGRYNRSPLISFRRLDAGSSSIAVRVAIQLRQTRFFACKSKKMNEASLSLISTPDEDTLAVFITKRVCLRGV